MATPITIKRYDGSNWEELNPATTIAQVDGLESRLTTIENGKQDKSNLVTSVSSSSSDTQYPSAKLFYTTTTGIMEVAEGKTASYTTQVLPHTNGKKYLLCGGNEITSTIIIPTDATIDAFNNITVDGKTIHLFEVTDSSDSLPNFSSYIYLYKLRYSGGDYTIAGSLSDTNIKTSDLNVGDILFLIPTDLPDFWWTGSAFSKLETTKTDLSDYVTLETAQTISGAKEFSNTITVSDGANGSTITGGNYLTITNNNAGVQITGTGEAFTIGSSTYKWKLDINGSSGTSGQTLIIDSNGKPNWGTATDNDHYPTTFTWSNGTTAGPTGSLTGNSGFSAVSFGAIPAAGSSQSGIVTTGSQTFSGNKTFLDSSIFNTSIAVRGGSNYATISASSSLSGDIALTLPSQTGTLSLVQTFLDSNQPSGAHAGDIWFQSAAQA